MKQQWTAVVTAHPLLRRQGAAAAKEGGADTGANLFEIYQITDTGVALQATVAGSKTWQDKDLNK